MYEIEKQRFVDNYNWFRQFFKDIEYLFGLIGRSLASEFPLPERSTYNQGSHKKMYLPQFYVLYMGGGPVTIHVYAILDMGFLRNEQAFLNEPSIIVIKHSNGEKYAHITEGTAYILRNDHIEWEELEGSIISGTILTGGLKGAHFQAFQVLLDSFINNNNPTATIRTEIVDRLHQLPELPNDL